jgi:hypothetical protein
MINYPNRNRVTGAMDNWLKEFAPEQEVIETRKPFNFLPFIVAAGLIGFGFALMQIAGCM